MEKCYIISMLFYLGLMKINIMHKIAILQSFVFTLYGYIIVDSG